MNDDNETNSNKQEDDFLMNNPEDTNPMNDLKENEKLTNDVSDDTPFSEPDDIDSELDPTSQQFDADSNIDDHEKYDAGSDIASGAKSNDQNRE